MTEEELNALVREAGVEQCERTAQNLRTLMPTLIYSKAGSKTLAFITALEAAIERAKTPTEPPLD